MYWGISVNINRLIPIDEKHTIRLQKIFSKYTVCKAYLKQKDTEKG